MFVPCAVRVPHPLVHKLPQSATGVQQGRRPPCDVRHARSPLNLSDLPVRTRQDLALCNLKDSFTAPRGTALHGAAENGHSEACGLGRVCSGGVAWG